MTLHLGWGKTGHHLDSAIREPDSRRPEQPDCYAPAGQEQHWEPHQPTRLMSMQGMLTARLAQKDDPKSLGEAGCG
jgi:hypothetical protein